MFIHGRIECMAWVCWKWIEIVERVGGSIISKYKSKAFYMEIAKKNTKRFDVTSFKEKYPQLYESFLIDGESVELKTKVVK